MLASDVPRTLPPASSHLPSPPAPLRPDSWSLSDLAETPARPTPQLRLARGEPLRAPSDRPFPSPRAVPKARFARVAYSLRPPPPAPSAPVRCACPVDACEWVWGGALACLSGPRPWHPRWSPRDRAGRVRLQHPRRSEGVLGTAPRPLLRTFEQKWWEAPAPGCVSRSVRCRAQETWKGTRCHSLLRPPEPRVRAWGGGAGCTPTRPAQSWLPQGPPASPALGWQPGALPPLPFASWGFSPSPLGTVPPRGREGPRGTVAHSGSRPERPTLSRPHF